MFSTLVVPLDGSALAERAVPYAVRLAQARQGQLILMRAALAPPPRTLDGSDWERDQAEAVEDADHYLREVAESVSRQVAAVEIVTAYGRPAGLILETAARYSADGIVMATHGRTGLPHLLYGSVTEAVLAQTSVPVFVVHARPGEQPLLPFSLHTARVLVPHNGSEFDTPARQAALEIVGQRGEIILVMVIAPPDHVLRDDSGHVLAYMDQLEETALRRARAYLTRIGRELRDQVPLQVTVDVRFGDPASGITRAAVEEAADLIVMATHGRTGIRRALVGSVAGTVLRTGPTPVLLVHPHTPAAAEGEKHLHASPTLETVI